MTLRNAFRAAANRVDVAGRAMTLVGALCIACGQAPGSPDEGATEDVSDAGAGDAGAGDAGAGDAGDGGDGPPDAGGDPPAACEVAPGHVVLQRLTRDEYDRSVRDLFGVAITPARSFPPDSATGGFDNNASSLTISSQLFELLLDAAEQVAAEAIADHAAEILTCDPTATPEAACRDSILTAQARRVYRRPASADEVASLSALAAEARADGDSFEASIEHALGAMLVSPQFLYRGIVAPGHAPALDENGYVLLDSHALATRLSYFLWGSTPDDALLDHADRADLHGPGELRAEFDRMLLDARASYLYSGFFSRWLNLGKLDATSPDPELFPAFDAALRADMGEEVRLFFEDVRQRDGSPLEFITGTRTFASPALAAIYGISGVTGPGFMQVDLDPNRRAGVLTMPAILSMTSDPVKTNIVKRGAWLADSILCAKPPPPPEGVSPLPEPLPGETERQRLDRHRSDPVCTSCHLVIDPLGYPFESFDPLGAWRDEVDGEPTDTTGALPDGTVFDGIRGLVEELEAGPAYGACLSERLLTYALGRTPSVEERCMLEALGEQAVRSDTGFSEVLWAIAASDAFRKRDAEEPN